MSDTESTDYYDCINGYDYFRRMDAFTGTPEEVAVESTFTMTVDTSPKKGVKATQTLGAKRPEQSSAFRTGISSAKDLNRDTEEQDTSKKK